MPLSVALNGRTSVDGKMYNLAIRILAGLVALALLPLTLTALSIKWWKRDEWENKPIVGDDEPVPEPEEAEVEPLLEKEEAIEKNRAEIARIQQLDTKLGTPTPGSWRAFGKKHGETDQTFDLFLDDAETNQTAWPDHRPLFIQRIGDFSPEDLKIIEITCDFLNVMYSIPIKLQDESLTMDQLTARFWEKFEKQHAKNLEKAEGKLEEIQKIEKLKNSIEETFRTSFPREKNKQYDAELARTVIQYTVQADLKAPNEKAPQLIAFTSEDLFAQSMQNFVFGFGDEKAGIGIWSNARFGNPSKDSQTFNTCLLRMMKTATHEFGHMRGLPHCTDYACNMGGGMSMDEMDGRSLLFCAQDTAKICYLTQTSVLGHEQKLLRFFQNFNQKYQLQCDFSKEIGTLKARITKLSEK